MDHIPNPDFEIKPPSIAQRLVVAEQLSADELARLITPDLKETGEAILREYRTKGFLAVRAQVLGTESHQMLLITEGRVKAGGKYAAFLPEGKELTQKLLDTAIARAQASARANNESLFVNIDRVADDGSVLVVLDGKPNDTSGRSLAVSTTSFGPRYSGSDVLVLSGAVAKGNGVALDASATVGLADLRADSKGGNYLGLAAGASKATEYGLFSLHGSYSRFKVGGPNVDLDQTGEVVKGEAEWSYALNANITPFVGAAVTRQTSRIGAADWSDTVTSTALKAGVRGQKTFGMKHGLGVLSGDIGLEQGLTASRRLDAPGYLLGDINPRYRALSGNADLSIPVSEAGARLSFSGGAQRASAGTPSGSQFYAGGPGRGVSYHTGVYAAPSGVYGSVQWTSAALDQHLGFTRPKGVHNVQAFVGMDAAKVRPVGASSLTAKSVHVGVRFQVSDRVSGQVGYAAPIGGNALAKPRITFFLTGTF